MPNEEVLGFLETRRSVRPTMFSQDGPSAAELRRMLSIGLRVPDHKKLAPWRFIVFEGEAREKIGDVFAAACTRESGDTDVPSEVRLETERTRFLRAPVVICLVSRIQKHRAVPEMEQVLSAGAAGFNLCLAANALGYATCWLTEWMAVSPGVRAAFGLAENERIAGFIYVGKPTERQEDRERPVLDDKVSFWT